MGVAIEKAAGPWNVTREEYFADHSRFSNSMFRDFAKSVGRFRGLYIDHTIEPDPPSKDKNFGLAHHVAVLEPHRWAQSVAVSPIFKGKGSKALRQSFKTMNAGRIIIDEEEHRTIRRMREAIEDNKAAREYLGDLAEGDAKAEQPIRWTDPETGLPMKALIDLIMDSGVIADIKTCDDASPEAWSREMAKWKYHRQAAHYMDGAWHALKADGPFVFIACSKQEPHDVVAHAISDKSLQLGRTQNARYAKELARRLESGDWSNRWGNAIQEATLPRYCFYDE